MGVFSLCPARLTKLCIRITWKVVKMQISGPDHRVAGSKSLHLSSKFPETAMLAVQKLPFELPYRQRSRPPHAGFSRPASMTEARCAVLQSLGLAVLLICVQMQTLPLNSHETCGKQTSPCELQVSHVK